MRQQCLTGVPRYSLNDKFQSTSCCQWLCSCTALRSKVKVKKSSRKNTFPDDFLLGYVDINVEDRGLAFQTRPAFSKAIYTLLWEKTLDGTNCTEAAWQGLWHSRGRSVEQSSWEASADSSVCSKDFHFMPVVLQSCGLDNHCRQTASFVLMLFESKYALVTVYAEK